MKRLGFAVAALLIVSLPVAAATQEVLSNVYTIEKKYRSMEGPAGINTIFLGDQDHPEILWLTGIKTEVVGEDGKSYAPQEFMCHVNIEIDPMKHKALFDLKRIPASRLMTLSQGVFEMHTPEGYGFPIASIEPIIAYTQVLNLNDDHPNGRKVRHRLTFEYVRDKDLKTPMKPLFNAGVSGLVRLADNPIALASTMDMPMMADNRGVEHHSAADCLVGMRAPNANGMGSDYTDPSGQKLTGHWVVPPGKQVNHSDVTWFLQLPYDTKLHLAVAHLHPFAQSLELRDTTTGKTIWKAEATQPKEGIGLAHVTSFDSTAGVPMYRNHKYEVISVYDNTTSQNQDSMASMFFGFDDPEFVKPTAAQLADRVAATINPTSAVIRTTAGDFMATLLRDQAPHAVTQFARLVSVGALSHARIVAAGPEITVSAPASDDARALLPRFDRLSDPGVPHDSGTISICPASPLTSIVAIAIETAAAPERNGRCTAFARVSEGADVLAAIVAAPEGAHIEVTGIQLLDRHTPPPAALAPAKPVTASVAAR